MSDLRIRVMNALGTLFLSMSPAVFVATVACLFALTIWAGQHAWVSARIFWGSGNAPEVALDSGATGLVKVRGTAQPRPPAPGFDPSSIVFAESHRRTSSQSATSSRTVGDVLILTERGACTLNVDHAEVVPTTSESSHAFMDRSQIRSSGEIRRDDPVFALGALQSAAPGSVAAGPRYELRPVGGVLLLSGVPEREVRILFGIWLTLQGPAALLLTAILLFGTWVHITSYPPGDLGSVRTFLETLRRAPLGAEPGISHPAWPPSAEDAAVGESSDAR